MGYPLPWGIVLTVWMAGCVDVESSEMGRVCEPGALLLDPEGWTTAHEIEGQEGCDCLTYRTQAIIVSEGIHNRVEVTGHFCTAPCADYRDCTRTSACVVIFPEDLALPQGVESRYCVPSCLVNGCPEAQVCHPPRTEDRTDWYCGPSSDGT